MNIKDLKPGSYQVVSNKLNINNLPQNSFQAGVFKPVENNTDSGLKSFAIGAGKGAINTFTETAGLGERLLRGTLKTVLPKSLEDNLGVSGELEKTSAEKFVPEELRTPENTAESAGFISEQALEYLLPSLAATKGIKAISTGSKLANLASKALSEALLGGGITALQGGTKEQVGTATAIGAALPVVGKAIGSASKALKSTKSVEEAIGQIAQGKTKNITSFGNALRSIETDGVKTFKDLQTQFSKAIPEFSQAVDDELLKDKGVYKLSELLSKSTTKSGKTVSTNYISRALDNLEELYTSIGDDVKKIDIKDVIKQSKSVGLTRKEVNDISRLYNLEFGQKAFSKTGEALTSVNARAYENTRKGLKEIARQGIGGEEAKLFDKQLSDIFDAKKLVDKNVEAVNRIKQKIQERGWFEKTGGSIAQIIDTLTGGTIKGFVAKFIPSNVGYKTMNYLDIEKALQKNISLIKKASNAETESEFIKIMKSVYPEIIQVLGVKGGAEMVGQTSRY